MEIVKIIAIAVAFAVAVWVLYTLVKMSDKAKEEHSNEAPYKVEPPMSAEQLVLPYKPIDWTFANAPEPKPKRGRPAGSKNKPREHLRVVPPNAKPFVISVNELRIAKRLGLTAEQYVRERIEINKKESSKPKRKYTKRSEYWSGPKVKTKMSKARKAKRKSK
jgi:hypothetical protein